jgi:hypothetical protein
MSAVVPPGVIVRLRGTSGSVRPEVTVTIEVAAFVAAITAVVEALATFLLVAVYPKLPE